MVIHFVCVCLRECLDSKRWRSCIQERELVNERRVISMVNSVLEYVK